MTVTVVGIGEDGWDGLGRASRDALLAAARVIGSPRQLALLPPYVPTGVLPTPLLPGLRSLLDAGGDLCFLASGDPMLHGLGATFVRLGARPRVLPAVSSASHAAARLGWSLPDVEVVSLVTAPVASLLLALADRARVLVLVRDGTTAAEVRGLLDATGFAASTLTVLEHLGGPAETVATFQGGVTADLAVLAVACVGVGLTRVPGLPDEAFENDGQVTRREVRALVLAALAPAPGHVLWDVGAGSGSIGIEWLRSTPRTSAVAVEPRQDRAERAGRNAVALGVPQLQVVIGEAPAALAGLPQPDAVFVGGGLTAPGVLDVCWGALRPGGRFVANGVTLETEALLVASHKRFGGELVRLEISRAAAIGSFTGWRPGMPITQLQLTKGRAVT